MSSDANHCSFVLLAEFDIFEGAQLKYQFPQPLGIDESVLAMSMLPDGADTQLDDWTIFFLNQTPFNTISPVLALETPEVKRRGGGVVNGAHADRPDLLCVLNLVRTKHDKTLDRGAKVRALAICTRHPFIQIFKPVLLMALDDYFSDPSQDCLARCFDAVNSMDLSGAPILTRHEKIVMRSSERKDIFAERFTHLAPQYSHNLSGHASSSVTVASGTSKPQQHRSTDSGESYSSFEDGIMRRNRGGERNFDENRAREAAYARGRERADTASSAASGSQQRGHHQYSPSESSFMLGESAVWVGDESELEFAGGDEDSSSVVSLVGSATLVSSTHRRSSIDTTSSSSHSHGKGLNPGHGPTTNATASYYDPQLSRPTIAKDTHFYHTSVAYKGHQLPIKMPLSTFPEEVGDYSLITLIKVFSSHHLVSGPLHPHLHTNGPQTHPIIILFNALVTGKRIIFMGHKRPAGEVSSFVLAACALGSGCGAVLRGFIERSFPYANLNNRDEWELVPAYIAGVTNPIFESSRMWDLLLDIGSGQMVVAKDIHTTYPPSPVPAFGGTTLIIRSGTLKAESSNASEDDIGRGRDAKDSAQKADFAAKSENNVDNLFIEDIRSAIEYHFGESLVRVRFTEYVTRFVRLASRYEEEVTGSTKFGYPSTAFVEGSAGRLPKLGSGIVFSDDATRVRELTYNASRIEAWRRTNSYHYCVQDFNTYHSTNPIRGFDVLHQLFRLRNAKKMPDSEVGLIMRTIADNLKSYDQAVELLAYLMPHGGGLLHLGFGLFHQQESIRETTVDIFNQLRAYPVGVLFLQALNHFQRYAYVRQAHVREKRALNEQQHHHQLPQQPPQPLYPTPPPRALLNRSDSGAGERQNGAF